MSTASWTSASFPVPESTRRPRGLIDTSVVIDLGMIDPGALPEEVAVSAITMAELAVRPRAAEDPAGGGRRRGRRPGHDRALRPPGRHPRRPPARGRGS